VFNHFVECLITLETEEGHGARIRGKEGQREVFQRYDIVNDADLRAAAEKQAAYLSKKATSVGTLSGTLVDFSANREDTATDASR